MRGSHGSPPGVSASAHCNVCGRSAFKRNATQRQNADFAVANCTPGDDRTSPFVNAPVATPCAPPRESFPLTCSLQGRNARDERGRNAGNHREIISSTPASPSPSRPAAPLRGRALRRQHALPRARALFS